MTQAEKTTTVSATDTTRENPMSAMRKAVLAMGLLLLAGRAPAQPAPAASASVPAATPAIAGWDAFVERLRQLGPKMLDRLPPELRSDPQVQQEVGRLMLESLSVGSLAAISGDPDRPVFLPALNQTINVSQPNADTVYKRATITPGGTYRLRGRIGNIRMARVGQMSPNPAKPGSEVHGYLDLKTLPRDKSGRFDVVLSPARPAGWRGSWYQLDPRASTLVVRFVASDWEHERDPTLAIERLDTPATRPRVPAAVLEQRLRRLPDAVDATALMFIDHVSKLFAEGYVNRLKVFDVSQIGGQLTGQFYYEGGYDLADDEALVVEAKVPAKCLYYSMILTNPIYETTDWVNNQSSLNDSQLHVDPDGVLRVVISARDPGVANWLDTAGYAKGVVQGRWTECSAQPVPSARKVKLSELATVLPAATPRVTAAERERILRDRRAAFQQRTLW